MVGTNVTIFPSFLRDSEKDCIALADSIIFISR